MARSKKDRTPEQIEAAQIRKQLAKQLALQAGVTIGTAALTTVTGYLVGKALSKNADPIKVVFPDDYTPNLAD